LLMEWGREAESQQSELPWMNISLPSFSILVDGQDVTLPATNISLRIPDAILPALNSAEVIALSNDSRAAVLANERGDSRQVTFTWPIEETNDWRTRRWMYNALTWTASVQNMTWNDPAAPWMNAAPYFNNSDDHIPTTNETSSNQTTGEGEEENESWPDGTGAGTGTPDTGPDNSGKEDWNTSTAEQPPQQRDEFYGLFEGDGIDGLMIVVAFFGGGFMLALLVIIVTPKKKKRKLKGVAPESAVAAEQSSGSDLSGHPGQSTQAQTVPPAAVILNQPSPAATLTQPVAMQQQMQQPLQSGQPWGLTTQTAQPALPVGAVFTQTADARVRDHTQLPPGGMYRTEQSGITFYLTPNGDIWKLQADGSFLHFPPATA
jgi:hypothetical protein